MISTDIAGTGYFGDSGNQNIRLGPHVDHVDHPNHLSHRNHLNPVDPVPVTPFARSGLRKGPEKVEALAWRD
jgi:hypothetical protein